jgi:hypothetical protein
MGQWKDLVTYKSECRETDERMEIVTLKIQPSEELRGRGEEITAAYEAWRAGVKKPRGYKKLERAANKAMNTIAWKMQSMKRARQRWRAC